MIDHSASKGETSYNLDHVQDLEMFWEAKDFVDY